MKIPFEKYCACGEKAIYPFETEGAYDQMLELWNKAHSGAGHGVLDKAEYQATKKRGEFNKAKSVPVAPLEDDSKHF